VLNQPQRQNMPLVVGFYYTSCTGNLLKKKKTCCCAVSVVQIIKNFPDLLTQKTEPGIFDKRWKYIEIKNEQNMSMNIFVGCLYNRSANSR